MRQIVVTFALIGCAAAIPAQELPIAEVEVSPAEISVGETIRLRVTVLSPTWFPTPPEFPSFELANMVVRLPPNNSRPTSRHIGHDTWSGIVRNYEIHPLLGARYRLDDLAIQVTYADPDDRSPVTVDVSLPPVEFRAVVPTGAETLDPYLAGRQLTLTRGIEGESDSLIAGDALIVRYTAELDGLPAMFLPPLVATEEIPGVSVYTHQPLLEDAERSRRSETLTYVFEAGGQFELPAIELSWWNTEISAIEITSVPSLTVSVAGPPVPAATDSTTDRPAAWRSVAAWFAILLPAAFVAWRGLRWSLRPSSLGSLCFQPAAQDITWQGSQTDSRRVAAVGSKARTRPRHPGVGACLCRRCAYGHARSFERRGIRGRSVPAAAAQICIPSPSHAPSIFASPLARRPAGPAAAQPGAGT